ncbi:hypothetical protein SAMN04488563_6486 [Jiangella alkaliphila]|uniref:Uncharacterized protein n=1 Tax=Jiangella alkaliphila TaxID=419479 RepID=A0A1H2LPU5_9ACTN|nr:hypothetical protein SAMN04488563_6486 [Jiangella alkaliphila]
MEKVGPGGARKPTFSMINSGLAGVLVSGHVLVHRYAGKRLPGIHA